MAKSGSIPLLAFLEQGTSLDARFRRLTRLEPAGRRAFLERLTRIGGLLAQAARGVRDLCLLGFYQDARTWQGTGYGGPLVVRPPPGDVRAQLAGSSSHYAGLLAPAGAIPSGALT